MTLDRKSERAIETSRGSSAQDGMSYNAYPEQQGSCAEPAFLMTQ